MQSIAGPSYRTREHEEVPSPFRRRVKEDRRFAPPIGGWIKEVDLYTPGKTLRCTWLAVGVLGVVSDRLWGARKAPIKLRLSALSRRNIENERMHFPGMYLDDEVLASLLGGQNHTIPKGVITRRNGTRTYY